MTNTATVETLAAEVRVLMVGNRQITLSVARQLDRVGLCDLEPFGRVKLGDGYDHRTVIGRSKKDGSLVVSWFTRDREWSGELDRRAAELPLIVLAGLR